MFRRRKTYAWIAALGMLVHLGAAGAEVWCKAMGLMAASCCPDTPSEHPEIVAPSDCCRPALEAPETGRGEPNFEPAPVVASLPWDELLPPDPARPAPALDLEPRATPPPIRLLSTIVLLR